MSRALTTRKLKRQSKRKPAKTTRGPSFWQTLLSGNFDYVYATIVFLILVVGLVMLASASSVIGLDERDDSFYFLKRQLFLGIVPGIVALVFFFRWPYQNWKQLAFLALILTLVLLVLVFVPGFGFGAGGARRWIDFFGLFLIQPAEIAKLSFLIYFVTWVVSKHKRVEDYQLNFQTLLLIFGAIGLLLALQPDMGSLSVILVSSLVVYFVAGAPVKHFVWIGAIGVVLFIGLLQVKPYLVDRFLVFLDPAHDPQGIGYQIQQAQIAIGSGGWLGLGLGQSQQKHSYLPEVEGDSIFAIMAEELGFILSLIFVLLFVALTWRGVKIAREAPDIFGKLLAVGITTWFGFQAIVNMSAISGLMPLTGIPLPFVSYGSSAMVMTLAAVGLMLNISKREKVLKLR